MAQAIIYPPSQDFVQKTLSAALLQGITASASLSDVTGIQNKRGVMIIDRVDTNGNPTPTKREVIIFTGTSGLTVTTLTRNADSSGSDQDHGIGAVVEFSADVLWAQALVDGITQIVDPATGLLDNTKVVTATGVATLTNKTLTTPKIASLYQDSIGGSNLLTMPAATDTLVGKATTDVLTNKTLTKPIMDATNPSAQTYTPSAAGTATLDLGLANEHRITMPAGNITIALSNDTNAQKFIVSTTQDGTGSRTVTWFTTIKWAGGVAPTLSTTASKRDTFGFIRTGSGTYDGFVIGQNI